MPTLRFWKPYGVLCQFTDADGRPTLGDYIRIPGVYAAGRLDTDSEGLLILSDSGPLIAKITQPRQKTWKTYWVHVENEPTDAQLDTLRNGVHLKDGVTAPARVQHIEPPEIPERVVPIRVRKRIPTSWLEVQICEGRNRQVRRMTAAVGLPTLRLLRTAIGSITLAGLEVGLHHELSEDELRSLWLG